MLARHEYQLEEWEQLYRGERVPIPVDFRALTNGAIKPDRYTHLLHPYPAKLLPQIPYFFLRSIILSGSGIKTVADPFCGSGTVLLEAAISGHHAIGADTNPLARLIAKVKTRPINEDAILNALRTVNQSARRIRVTELPRVVNLTTWYREETAIELAKLRIALKSVKDRKVREFLKVCLSVCARKVSLADPRLSVPVRINASRRHKYGPHYRQLKAHLRQLIKVPVISRFNDIVTRNAERMGSLHRAISGNTSVTILNDARTADHSVGGPIADLIITSPPYVGAQKYIRSSSLSLGWLDLAYEGQLRDLERQTIGREHFPRSEVGTIATSGVSAADHLLQEIEKIYPLRAHIAKSYLVEMRQALQAMFAMLKPQSSLVLVTGTNTVCGFHFDTPSYLEEIARQVGFKTRFQLIDHIKSRGLMTKRHKTAGIISSEIVLCMRKGGE